MKNSGGPNWLVPDWPSPADVGALMTTRSGGHSHKPFDDGAGGGGMNLGLNCDDDPATVQANRDLISGICGFPICWLQQHHGTRVISVSSPFDAQQWTSPRADATVTNQTGVALAILTADCLPVLFAAPGVIGAAHAGWRGLAEGILEDTVDAMVRLGAARTSIVAWFGAAIGPQNFQVGSDVLSDFCRADSRADSLFTPMPDVPGKWLADLPGLARQRLVSTGLTRIQDSGLCTVADAKRFYSYRRDQQTGRMAALIWRSEPKWPESEH